MCVHEIDYLSSLACVCEIDSISSPVCVCEILSPVLCACTRLYLQSCVRARDSIFSSIFVREILSSARARWKRFFNLFFICHVHCTQRCERVSVSSYECTCWLDPSAFDTRITDCTCVGLLSSAALLCRSPDCLTMTKSMWRYIIISMKDNQTKHSVAVVVWVQILLKSSPSLVDIPSPQPQPQPPNLQPR